MRRLKKKIYLGLCAATLGALTLVRYTSHPAGTVAAPPQAADTLTLSPDTTPMAQPAPAEPVPAETPTVAPEPAPKPAPRPSEAVFRPHPIRSVPSYERAFPDGQEVQYGAARRWGVSPVADRQEAERRKSELVYIGSDPFFDIDPHMRSSIPYLVPRASTLLHDIGRA